ncbi:MAG: lysophospholipid acyltransferase family protein [Acidobacteriota bacterium]|jgi:1-acyl-sn-glycerol-3-phosphate acyltransferase
MRVPVLGAAVPRRGNWFSRGLGKLCLRLYGWRIEGEFPNVSKLVIIVAPHTSNWDFVFGIAADFAVGLRASWLGKDSLFKKPFEPFFTWLGGIPTYRTQRRGMVDSAVAAFKEREALVLGVAPEGTRKAVEEWRTGFYHIALNADVPILMVYIDYVNKVLGLGPVKTPTGDLEKDMAEIRAFYRPYKGKPRRGD